jgi:hypothetical protein
MNQEVSNTMDFDSWLAEYVPKEIEYYAVYDPDTFLITGIYPSGPAQEKPYKIKIENILAEEIINGSVNLSRLSIDLENQELVIKENYIFSNQNYNFYRIDSKIENLVNVSLTIKYVNSERSIYFIPSDNLIKTKEKFVEYKKPCLFYITSENDPNILYDTIHLELDNLFSSKKLIFPLDTCGKKFSVYTKKIFKNYYLTIT